MKQRAHICLALAVVTLCLSAGPSYAGALVAHWALDGDSLDSSGNHNDAALHGNVTYVQGMYGQAAEFHGNGDYLQVPNNPGLQLLSGQEFSVAAFVNADGLGQQDVLIHGLGCSTWSSWFLGVQGGEPDATLYADSFVFGVRSSNGGAYIGATAEAAAGEWVHVAATYDGAILRLYTNGEEQGQAAVPLPYTSTEDLYIGGDPGCSGRSWYIGKVDDICIFSRMMTAAQVRELASGTLPAWLKANKPNPADGTIGVAMPLLQWSKGETATLHSVYLGTSPDLTEADLKVARSPMTMFYYTEGLQPGVTYYWRVDEIDADGVTVYTGDVWSFVTQALTAYYPSPLDGVSGTSTNPELTWMAGQATVKHHVYFGTDADAVAQGAADTDRGELEDPNFIPGALDSLTTYLWRVDELVADGSVKTGPVWSFTTCLPVDDFESYTDDEGNRIYETWIDGWTNGTGSMVGYAQSPFTENTIVHGGGQAMPLDYNNVNEPFYSEAEREFADPQDWVGAGADSLILYVRGRLSNSPAPLYVALEDTSNHVGVVTYSDPAVTKALDWTEWKIPLDSFTGVNAARISKIYIGLGDRQNPVQGGTGLIFLDDICVAKP